MIFIYILLATSLGLNIFFIVYDWLPYVVPVIKRKVLKSKRKIRDANTLEYLILSASMSLIKSEKSIMSWRTGGSYSVIYSKIFRKTFNNEFRNYNYPRGYLLYGLSEYLIKSENSADLLKLKNVFDKFYINEEGDFNFNFNKVDQATFGLTAINLYNIYKEKRYRIFAERIYSFIHHKYINDKIILYRENSICELNDTIGMVIPFLVRYYHLNNDSDAIEIANNQMHQFIKYAVDEKTFIPSHGFSLNAKIKTGSSNWGRGIGWYFLGLKELYEFNRSFKHEYEGLCNTVRKLKNKDDFWGQFPGSNDNFDASTTTMFLYSLPKEDSQCEEMLDKLNMYISKSGFILQTSGDTKGLNSYSNLFGKSELSQGILMLILSRYKS